MHVHPRVCIQIDSLHRLIEDSIPTGVILVLDEIESILS